MPKTPALVAEQTQNEDEIESNLYQAGTSESHDEFHDDKKDSQEFQGNTHKRRSKSKLTKEDIGFPYNFKHISHVGWDISKGYHLRRTRQKNGDISQPQNFKHLLHVDCEENTSDDDALNAAELKSSPGVSDTPQKDQESGNESRGELKKVKKNLQNDKSRRRAPQPPHTPKTPVPTLIPSSPTTPSGVTTPIPAVNTASLEISDKVTSPGPKYSPPSPVTTKTTALKATDNSTTTLNPSTETPPSPPSKTPLASTPSTVTPTVPTLSSPSPSSKATPIKVTPLVATRRFANTTTPVPTLNVELNKPLKMVVPMPSMKPGSPLPTVKPTSSSTSGMKAPMPTVRSLPPSPSMVPRAALRPAPAQRARTLDFELKDNSSGTPTKTKSILYNLIANGKYTNAVDLVKTLDTPALHEVMSETIQKLLDSHSTAKAKLMSFVYKLWHSDAKSVVRIHFPHPFEVILGRENVKIVNKGYGQALKLDAHIDSDNGRHAWGDAKDKSSKQVSWQLVPVWENNEVTFKLHNVDCNMFLKLGAEVNDAGDRAAWGLLNADTDSYRYYLEPYMEDEDFLFFIINYEHGQGLKLAVGPDDKGDRALVGHNGDIYSDEGRFRWIISAW